MTEGPIYEYGDMWSVWGRFNTAFIVTTNSTLTSTGDLVMGRGIAEQLRARRRVAARFFGRYIKESVGSGGVYGCVVWDDHSMHSWMGAHSAPGPGCWLGVFQVKKHFRDTADLKIIEKSVLMLDAAARRNTDRTFHLNYPGIGFGRLAEGVVDPLLRRLPSNVHVWRFTTQCYDQIPMETETDDSDSEGEEFQKLS
jgi:hypothetical protein